MKRKALLVLIGVFLLGMGAGILVDRLALHTFRGRLHAGRHADRLLHHLTARLQLSEQQQADVEVILRETHTTLVTIRHATRQRVDTVLGTAEGRIQALLTPEQRPKFATFMAERRARRQRWKQRRFGRSP